MYRRALVSLIVLSVVWSGIGMGITLGGTAPRLGNDAPAASAIETTGQPVNQSVGPSAEVEPKWSFSPDRRPQYETGPDGKTLYLIEQQSGEPTLVARDFQTGAPQWEQHLAISAGPSDYIDMRVTSKLITIIEGTTVYAYDRQNGEQKWQYSFTPIGSSPSLSLQSNGETMVITDDQEGITKNRLVGVDVGSGNEIWNRTIALPEKHKEAQLPYGPAEQAHVGFTTSTRLVILNMSLATGTINARHEITATEAGVEQFTFGTIVKTNEMFRLQVRYGDYPNSKQRILVYEDLSGEPVFNVSAPEIEGYPPLSNVYLQEENQITALEYPTGTVLWEKSTAVDELNHYDHSIYALNKSDSSPDQLHEIDPGTGEVNWSQTLAQKLPEFGGFRVQGETIYFKTTENNYYALNRESGKALDWKINLSTTVDNTDIRPLWNGEGIVATTSSYESAEQSKVYVFPEPHKENSNDGSTNTPPEITLSASSSTVSPNEGVTLVADATDPDSSDSTLQYQWATTASPDGSNPPSLTGQEDTVTFSTTGTYTYKVTVTDDSGATATATVTVTVEQEKKTGNKSPLSGAAGEYDSDNNGQVSLGELGTAAADFAQGGTSLTELASVAAAFAQS